MNTSHSLLLMQGSGANFAPWMGSVCSRSSSGSGGQNSFVCSKHFSQFGICRRWEPGECEMLDGAGEQSSSCWCELCALLANRGVTHNSRYGSTPSLSVSGNNAMLAVTALFLQINSANIFSGTVIDFDKEVRHSSQSGLTPPECENKTKSVSSN